MNDTILGQHSLDKKEQKENKCGGISSTCVVYCVYTFTYVKYGMAYPCRISATNDNEAQVM